MQENQKPPNLIELICDQCKQSYNITISERASQLKKFKCQFNSCSNKCRIIYLNANGLNRGTKRQINKFSPFQKLFYIIKNNKHQFDLTVQDIFDAWQIQQGKCAVTGLLMSLPTHPKDKTPTTPNWASVDRIDSSKPYTKSNVQMVCLSVNLAKNDFTDGQIRQFIKQLREN